MTAPMPWISNPISTQIPLLWSWNGKYFSVTWTIENEAVSFALEEIPAAVMQFVKGNTYAYNTWLPSQTTTMNITFAGMSDEGALFNIDVPEA